MLPKEDEPGGELGLSPSHCIEHSEGWKTAGEF
jgi:hypothetical protein